MEQNFTIVYSCELQKKKQNGKGQKGNQSFCRPISAADIYYN